MGKQQEPGPSAGAAPPVVPAAAALAEDIARLEVEALPQAQPAAAAPMVPAAMEVETAADLTAIFELAFGVLAPNWNVQKSECSALGAGGAKVLLKYWPDGLGTMGPELGLAITVLAVAGPRVAARLPLREQPKKNPDAPVNGNAAA